jgi:BirA family biotin operon repressor/biotin-[acetyl-CoA-carboxylase] ligase
LEIVSFDELSSTQLYLIDKIKSKEYKLPIAIITDNQTKGIGSRDNCWIAQKGDLLFSLALKLDSLPSDLPLESISIYFAYLLKEVLYKYDKNIFLKWPNDFYVADKKIGGCVTKLIDDTIIVGIGINLVSKNGEFEYLDIDKKPQKLLEEFIDLVEKFPSWKYIFSKYQVEFNLSKNFYVHINGEQKSLKNAILCSDGSIEIDNKKVYSLR